MNTPALPAPPATPNGHAAGGTLIVDLSGNPDVLDQLYKEAVSRGVSIAVLVQEKLVGGVQRITASVNPADPDGRAAYASGRGLEVPTPEADGSN